MNRMYLRPITSLCVILFLIAVFTTNTQAGIYQGEVSSSIAIIKNHAALTSNCQVPFEERVEEQNQDSVTQTAFIISYLLVSFATPETVEIFTCRYGNHALTGNTPIYLAKRSILR